MTSRSIFCGHDQSKSAMGLKRLMPESRTRRFKASPGTLGDFGLNDVLDNLVRRPAVFGGAREEIIELRRQGAQADVLQLSR